MPESNSDSESIKASDDKTKFQLPVIDLSPYYKVREKLNAASGSESAISESQYLEASNSIQNLILQVRSACESIGFLVITGFPKSISNAIKKAAEISKDFPKNTNKDSGCSLNLNSCLASHHGDGAYGYFPMQSEALGYSAQVSKKPDLRQAFSMGPIQGVSERIKKKYLLQEESQQTSESDSEQTVTQEQQQKVFFRRVINFCYQDTPWPSDTNSTNSTSSDFRDAMEEFYKETSELGRVLLEIMARALMTYNDLNKSASAIDAVTGSRISDDKSIQQSTITSPSHFSTPSQDGEHCNSARVIWYPKLVTDAYPGQMRCGPHSDTGALTILWADGEGLEVQMTNQEQSITNNFNAMEQGATKPKKEDESTVTVTNSNESESSTFNDNVTWTPVYPGDSMTNKYESLIINIGDLMQKASNDKWKSTPHRVPAPSMMLNTNSNQDRLVLVLFVMLAADFQMGDTTQGEYSFGHFKRWGRNGQIVSIVS